MKYLAIAMRRAFGIISKPLLCLLLCACLTAGAGVAVLQKKAYACASCPCVVANHIVTRALIFMEHGEGFFMIDPVGLAYSEAHVCLPGIGTRGWIGYQFCRHREEFIVFYWFKEHILAAMMMMSEQLVTTAMLQMFILGSFFDAKQQLETQMLFQELEAKAHKDYHPSFEMCEIGTMARQLYQSDDRADHNAYVLSQHLQDRQMRNVGMASGTGKGLEVTHRWEQFRTTFCFPEDNNAELGPRTPNPICQGAALGGAPSRNWDVDYTWLVEWPTTINANFADGATGLKEEAVFALAANLYGNDVFEYWPEAYFNNPNNQDDFMYLRTIVAKRSVAQNSFNHIIGMKSEGLPISEEMSPFMENVFEQLGVPDLADRWRYVGGTLDSGITPGIRPSYYSQMEVLTKRLYQRHEFYTGLYDKPANVERKRAAMKALDLSQNFDIFKSKLRMEAALAVLTEIEIQKAQDLVQDRMNEAKDSGIE